MAKKRFIHPDTMFVIKVYGAVILGAVFAHYCDARLAESQRLKESQSTVDSVEGSPVHENPTDTLETDAKQKRIIENIMHKRLEKQK